MSKIGGTPINIKNKRAKFEYHLLDTYVAGIKLGGTEIKSIRNGKVNLVDSFCVVTNDEVFIRNMHIAEYENASFFQHNPKSDRKLLLKKKEIQKIDRTIKTKGLTIIPLRLFINEKGLAKVEIAIAQGKKLYDKRQDLKEKDDKRSIERARKDGE